MFKRIPPALFLLVSLVAAACSSTGRAAREPTRLNWRAVWAVCGECPRIAILEGKATDRCGEVLLVTAPDVAGYETWLDDLGRRAHGSEMTDQCQILWTRFGRKTVQDLRHRLAQFGPGDRNGMEDLATSIDGPGTLSWRLVDERGRATTGSITCAAFVPLDMYGGDRLPDGDLIEALVGRFVPWPGGLEAYSRFSSGDGVVLARVRQAAAGVLATESAPEARALALRVHGLLGGDFRTALQDGSAAERRSALTLLRYVCRESGPGEILEHVIREEEESVRRYGLILAHGLLDRLDPGDEVRLEDLVNAGRLAESTAIAACIRARRGRPEALDWFEGVFRSAGASTPQYVSYWCSMAVNISPWKWSSDAEKEAIVSRWQSVLADRDRLKWDAEYRWFEPAE